MEDKMAAGAFGRDGSHVAEPCVLLFSLFMSRLLICVVFSDYKANSENNPLNIAATRLASLERGIERRYFKQPLRDE